ncbi:sortase [Bacillus timonensis]|nr:sortase [Bacillus timonensis]
MIRYIKLSFLVCTVLIILLGYKQLIIDSSEKISLSVAYKVLKENKIDNFQDFEPKMGEVVGILSVPKLNIEIPIVEGQVNRNVRIGIVHHQESGYPNEKRMIQLSSTRDSVFMNFFDLRIGDKFILNLPYGSFTYEIITNDIQNRQEINNIAEFVDAESIIITIPFPLSKAGQTKQQLIVSARPVVEIERSDR